MGEPGTEKITLFGQTNFRNKKVKFGIKTDDRRRHIYTIGKTGMGKSQLLENMIISDIRNGYGACMIDPHGDMVENIIKCVPRNRVNDIIYFNPADVDYPIAFNVFEKVDVKYRPLVASGVVGVFKKIWADSWGPRLEYILNNCILALLEAPDSTLLGVMRILTDRKYREQVLRHVTDPMIRYFWTKEFSKYPEKEIAMIISPIQNKVGQYLSNAMIRNIVGQPISTINLRDVMDNKKVLLLNLSKGRVGEDASALLGALMITKIQLAAMSRVDIPEKERQDFYLYVDELQNFATDSFAGILSEARKYRLNLTMAHQYVEQLPETLQAAVFGNVGTMIAFRVGATDAEYLAKEFAPTFIEEDFVNLPKYHIYLKLMIDGVASQGFSANTLPPIAKPEGFESLVIENTRKLYSRPIASVEQELLEWWNLNDQPVPSTEEKSSEAKEKSEGNEDDVSLAEMSETVKNQVTKMIQQEREDRKHEEKVVQVTEVPIAVPKELEVKKVAGFEKLEKQVVAPLEESEGKFNYEAVDWYNIDKKTKELSFDGKYICDVCSADMFLDFAPRLDKPILCQKCVKKRDKFMKRVKREREEEKALSLAERQATQRLAQVSRPIVKTEKPSGENQKVEAKRVTSPKASNWGMMKTNISKGQSKKAPEIKPAAKVTFENENFEDDLKDLYGDPAQRQQQKPSKNPQRPLPPATIRIVGKPVAVSKSVPEEKKVKHEHLHTHYHVHADKPVTNVAQSGDGFAPAGLAMTEKPAANGGQSGDGFAPAGLAMTGEFDTKGGNVVKSTTNVPKPAFNPFADDEQKPAKSA
ncbi:MAG TPA: type IV secretion system DNA-binding domain-containing protein [bacterium]|nr:type IV secretion system DNA-binding domain-containing protein [bacterium]